MTAWMVVTVVLKSVTSWLIDTFITAWSSTITNCAAARMTSGPHFFIAVVYTPGTTGPRDRCPDAGVPSLQCS